MITTPDPLGLDLTDVSTSMPVLAAGLYVVKVSSIDTKPMKDNKPGNIITIKLTLEQDGKDIKGETVNPGFGIFTRFNLFNATVSEDGQKKAREIALQQLARFQEAVVGAKGAWTPDSYLDKLLTVKTKVRSDETYGDSTEVAQYVKKSNS